MNTYQFAGSAAQAGESARAEFMKKTYIHLAFAFLGFAGLEFVWLNTPIAVTLTRLMAGTNYGWLLVLGAFMAVSWIANKWAMSSTSRNTQYAGLILYVFAESIIFVPLLFIANLYAPRVIPSAALITGLLFAGLTFTAFTTGKDFSFLGGVLRMGGFIALGFIIASILFGFQLGVLFSSVMILFAAGSILYNTSNILHHYHTEQYVAASLSLFASVALLLWYVIQMLLHFSSSD